ncbi:MAG: NAD(P)-dependent oxidoreductase [Candidatus Hadarchaeales archaeon]
MTRALVTGACGAMGSRLVELLLQKGYEVTATDLDRPRGATVRNKDRIIRLGARFIPADLTQPRTLPPVVKDVDIVFHTASAFNYYMPFEIMSRINVDGTRNLCEAIVRENPGLKLMVHWSTMEIYGISMFDATRLPPTGELTEEHPPNPSSEVAYERTKYLQEQVVWDYHRRHGLPVLVIRPASVYGPGTLMDTVLFFLVTRGIITALPRLNFRWPLIHVSDVIHASVHLSEKEGLGGQVFNLVDDQNYTFSDVIFSIAQATGNRIYALPPLPPTFLKLIRPFLGLVQWMCLREIRSIQKKGKTPFVSEQTLRGFFREFKNIKKLSENFRATNKKLKATGYRLLYPDYRLSVYETARWYRERGYII